MGLFGAIWGGIKSFFGGSSSGGGSSSSYHYEPDKVKIAQIEADTKLKLADKEAERIALMRDAQLELIKAQTMSQMAIDEARTRQMPFIAEQLVLLQETMTEVAQKRIELIEIGSMPILKEIENFYQEIEDDINHNADEYTEKKLPQLLNLLGQYKEGTAQHTLFMQQISADMARQLDYTRQQLERIHQRQTAVIGSFLNTKEKIIEQTGEITAHVIGQYLASAIPIPSNMQQSIGDTQTAAMLEEGKPSQVMLTDGQNQAVLEDTQ